MDRRFYLAIVTPNEKQGYSLQFPDIPEAIIESNTTDDLLLIAKETLELCIKARYNDNKEIPVPITSFELKCTAPSFIIGVTVNVSIIKNECDNRAVKKTLTIPFWLNELAESKNVNFSRLLQSALKDELDIK